MRFALIKARGKRTQTEISKELQISQKYLSKLELGQRNPSIILAHKICKFYEMPIEKLFPDIFLPRKTP